MLRKLEKINLYESTTSKEIKHLTNKKLLHDSRFYYLEKEETRNKILSEISNLLGSNGRATDLTVITHFFDPYLIANVPVNDFLDTKKFPYVSESENKTLIDSLGNKFHLVELDFLGTKVNAVSYKNGDPELYGSGNTHIYYIMKVSDYNKIKDLKYEYEKVEKPEFLEATNKQEVEYFLRYYYIRKFKINDDLTVDVNEGVSLSSRNLKIIPIKFNIIKGSFNISNCKLKSLKNCPKEVHGHFDCSHNQLTSLEGAPEIVYESFNCAHNKVLFTEEDVRKYTDVKKSIITKYH